MSEAEATTSESFWPRLAGIRDSLKMALKGPSPNVWEKQAQNSADFGQEKKQLCDPLLTSTSVTTLFPVKPSFCKNEPYAGAKPDLTLDRHTRM